MVLGRLVESMLISDGIHDACVNSIPGAADPQAGHRSQMGEKDHAVLPARAGSYAPGVSDPRTWRLLSCFLLVVAIVGFVVGTTSVAWPALAASGLAFLVEIRLQARERGR